MRMSTRGRYGVRAMLDLAMSSSNGPVSLKEIASRQDISLDYLEQLLRKLRKADLVKSVRGPRGGFLLARAPDEITLWDIVAALEPAVGPVHCVDDLVTGKPVHGARCKRLSACATHVIWLELGRHTKSWLAGRSLADLVQTSKKLCDEAGLGKPLMFDI